MLMENKTDLNKSKEFSKSERGMNQGNTLS